ncbi:MAG: hypothetical protein ACRD1U_05535 [Vicinamibacterales bacterium]
MSDQQAGSLRGYLLGTLSDAERDAIEHGYFDQAEALDRVSAAEDDLIDDYLSGQLGAQEREQFERHYLASPRHRTRVAVARALGQRPSSAAAAPQPSSHQPGWRSIVAAWRPWPMSLQSAAAAALVVAIAAGVWLAVPDTRRSDIDRGAPSPAPRAGNAPAPPPPVKAAPPAPTVLALTLRPVQTRAPGADPPTVSIDPGADVVRLELQEDPAAAPLRQGRAIVRTVDGREVTRAPVVVDPESRTLAHMDIPASHLRPDDYIVALYESAAGRPDVERYRYFFRVR